MNRICLTKDGKLIEMQSGGDDRPDLMEMRIDTLRQNALNAGYIEADIEVKFVTDAEYAAIMEANKPIPTYEELRRAEYPSTDELVVALWEKVVEGRSATADVLQAKRETVKAKYPKP